jgi:hypothetical protein
MKEQSKDDDIWPIPRFFVRLGARRTGVTKAARSAVGRVVMRRDLRTGERQLSHCLPAGACPAGEARQRAVSRWAGMDAVWQNFEDGTWAWSDFRPVALEVPTMTVSTAGGARRGQRGERGLLGWRLGRRQGYTSAWSRSRLVAGLIAQRP